jgi:hypothetical protein
VQDVSRTTCDVREAQGYAERGAPSELEAAARTRVMLVTRIQSIATGMRMKMYSPVGDQKPSRAQFVVRSRKSAARPTPARFRPEA